MRNNKKTEKNDEISADFESIKKQDIENLQKTFEQIFGKTSEEIRERSSKLKKKLYFVGTMLVFLAAITYLFIQKINFVQF